jgi:UDP-N-acetylglucosamine acyltransferase
MPQIHETAIVHPKAELGTGVKVGPYAVIGKHVVIGDDCEIGSHVVIEGRTTMGKRNRLFTGAVVGSVPQDLKYKGEVSYLEIGDDNVFREYVDINTAEGEECYTRIGSNNLLMVYVHVAHNCTVQDNTILANSVTLAGHVTVESKAILGGLVGVHQFVTIGRYCMIGGMTKIVKDCMPYCMVDGNPAKTYGLNKIGLERAGFSPERIRKLKDVYRIVFRTKKKLQEAVSEIKLSADLMEDEDVRYFVDFTERVTRGILR